MIKKSRKTAIINWRKYGQSLTWTSQNQKEKIMDTELKFL